MTKLRSVLMIVVGLGLCSCALKPTDRRPSGEGSSETRQEILIPPPKETPKQAPSSKSYVARPKPMVMSAAVRHLMKDASSLGRQGDLDAAVTTIERALRIQPRNAALWNQLASFRLQQDQPDSAENLAKKSNILAGGDLKLKRKNWTLISIARRKLGNAEGAYRAKTKADQY